MPKAPPLLVDSVPSGVVSSVVDGVLGGNAGASADPTVYTEALRSMTDQLSTVALQQVLAIGTFFDAKHQLETQGLQQKLTVEAHKDYSPSDQMCRFGSFVKTIAHTESKSDLDKQALNQILNNRALNKANNASAEGADVEFQSRLEQFKNTYCDPQDNNNGLKALCKHRVYERQPVSGGHGQYGWETKIGGQDLERLNKDIDYARTINNPLTLDIDFRQENNNEQEVADEQDVIALGKNLYWPETFTVVPPDSLDINASRLEFTKYMRARQYVAMNNVAQNSYMNIAGMKTKAPDALGNESGGAFMKAMMREFGLEDDDIHELLGDNPSYHAQMEVLTKKIYQSPQFYTNLYDKPVNVERIGTSMRAISLMSNRDHHESLLRREMLLSLLVEQALSERREKIDAGLRDAAAKTPLR